MWHDHLLTILIPSNTNMPLYAVKNLDFSDTCELLGKNSKASQSALPGPLHVWIITAKMTETQKRKDPNHTSTLSVVKASAYQTFYPNIRWSIHRIRHPSAKNGVWPLSTWQRHGQTYYAGRPFSCVECEGTFTGLEPLQAYQQVRTGEKPHFCVSCGLAFTEPCALTRRDGLIKQRNPSGWDSSVYNHLSVLSPLRLIAGFLIELLTCPDFFCVSKILHPHGS